MFSKVVSTLLEILVEVQFPGPVGDAIFVSTLLEILGRGADAGLRLPPDVSTLLEILERNMYLDEVDERLAGFNPS